MYLNGIKRKIEKFPIKFDIVYVYFTFRYNFLKTLENSPNKVKGDFDIGHNKLTNLEFCPKIIKGGLICDFNELISLKGCTKKLRTLFCSYNQLITLEGSPEEVEINFYCSDNQLESLKGGPKYIGHILSCGYNSNLISFEGHPRNTIRELNCPRTPIAEIIELFTYGAHSTGEIYKRFIDSLDYNYLRGTNIIKHRFEEALEEIGKKLPESIQGYKYI